MRSVGFAMEHDVIAALIDGYTRLFGIDLNDLQSDIEESLYEHLEREPLDPKMASYDHLLALRKLVLYQLSQISRLRGRIDRVLDDFQRQIDEQIYDFTYYRREEPLPEEMVELMYEAQGLWSNMPHTLVAKHYNLVKKAAAKYHKKQKIDNQQAFADLLSAADEALFSAANRMYKNPKKDFRSFAWKILKEKIHEEQVKSNPVPHKVRQKLELLRGKREDFGIDGHSAEDYARLAELTGISPEEIRSLDEIEAVWGGGAIVDTGGLIEEIEVADLSPDALTLLISQETCDLMDNAIASLPVTQRNLIDIIYFGEMSLREAADHLNISFNSIKKTHRKAMETLREIMERDSELPSATKTG